MHIVYKDIALLEVKEDQNGVGWSIANGGGDRRPGKKV